MSAADKVYRDTLAAVEEVLQERADAADAFMLLMRLKGDEAAMRKHGINSITVRKQGPNEVLFEVVLNTPINFVNIDISL